jgi:hypothetical protein
MTVGPESGNQEERGSARPRSLHELGLRGPTLGVLQRQGVLSIEQLVEMSPEHLMDLRRVGLARMLEVRKALQAHGLDLRIDAESLPSRTWTYIQRISLVCCEHGECSLEIRSASPTEQSNETVFSSFVDAHRACGLSDGCELTVGEIETSHSLSSEP